MTTNILIFVHGMFTSADPVDPWPRFDSIWGRLRGARPELEGLISERVGTEWGQPLAGLPAREDHLITAAQKRVVELIDRGATKAKGEAGDHFMLDWHWFPPLRWLLDSVVRRAVIQRGFTDAAYYISPDGEARVREAIYATILKALEPYATGSDVRLHLVAESLGVTVAHDFLYALFNPDPAYVPGYATQDPKGSAVDELNHWRSRVQNGECMLGSFVAVASQLPLFLLRKQKLVELLAASSQAHDVRIDPTAIGLTDQMVRWVLFYDVDDLLAYPTRHLYSPRDGIEEFQVESADWPHKAHLEYWDSDEVVRRAADLIAVRST